MSEKKLYALGFAFDKDFKQVVLIRKNKPTWQKGLLNGVGGKVEPGETPYNAMVREFREETGVLHESWSHALDLEFHEALVSVYYTTSAPINECTSTTDETIELRSVEEVPDLSTIPNIPWMLYMCRSFSCGEMAPAFKVTETSC